MSLDIRFSQVHKRFCPHCGKELKEGRVIDSADSCGRAWYSYLESIGYYVPYEQLTKENDWYCTDMVLTKDQAEQAYQFAKKNEVYNGRAITMLIIAAMVEGDDVVVNADW